MKTESSLDFHYLVVKIKTGWLYIVLSIILCLSLALWLINTLPSSYKVSASIQVSDEANQTVIENLFDNMKVIEEKQVTANEVALLKSFDLIKQTCLAQKIYVEYYKTGKFRDQELTEPVPFNFILHEISNQTHIIDIPIRIQFIDSKTFTIAINHKGSCDVYNFFLDREGPSLSGPLETSDTLTIGEFFNSPIISFHISEALPQIGESYYVIIRNPNHLADEYRKRISVSPINKDASILEVEINSTVPEKDKRFIDQLIQLYTQRQFNTRNRAADQVITFIDRQLIGITDSLQMAEQELKNLRMSGSMNDFSFESKNLYEELTEQEKQKSEEAIKLKYYDYLINYVQKADNLNDIIAPSVMGIQDATLNNLINSLTQYTTEMTAINYSAKEKNPRYAILQKNIENTRKAILENVYNIKMSSKIRLNDFNTRSVQLQKEIEALPENERIQINAQRKFEFNDNVYNFYLQKRSEASIYKESNTAEEIIIDRPRLVGKEPVSPNKKVILAGFIGAGLFFSLGFIFLRDLTHPTINSREHTQNLLPFLTLLAELPWKKNRDKTKINGVTSESFRSLAYQLQDKLPKGVITITSLIPRDGKSYCTLNLAIALSFQERVLILNSDLTLSPLYKPWNQQASPFTQEQKKEFAITIYRHPQYQNVNVAHPTLLTSSDVDHFFSRANIQQLMDLLQSHFTYILVDCPSLNISATFYALTKVTSLRLLIVRENHTPCNVNKVSPESWPPEKSFILLNASRS